MPSLVKYSLLCKMRLGVFVCNCFSCDSASNYGEIKTTQKAETVMCMDALWQGYVKYFRVNIPEGDTFFSPQHMRNRSNNISTCNVRYHFLTQCHDIYEPLTILVIFHRRK